MLPHTLWSFLFLSVFSSLVRAQAQAFFPASIPLAVKNPYLSVWYQSLNTSTPLSNAWPLFWAQSGIMGWAGKIRVDGITYKWLGNDGTGIQANVTDVQITPTRSIFVMQAGPMNFTVTFLSPIEPQDWVKQSIPFTYVSIEAQALDGNTHAVQVYSDISAEWASGNRSSLVKWSNTNTGNTVYHEIELQDPQQDVEINNQAQDGKVYYAIPAKAGVTWQIDLDSNTRNQFNSSGSLTNVATTAFASISPVFSVFALAYDLGQIKATSSPVAWSVGYVRDPSITFTTATGATQQRRPYYTTAYSTIGDVIDAFTGDFTAATTRAVALDAKIMGAAANISSQYSDIVSLSTRQTMGALDITVGTDSSGNVLPGDIKIFMKNLGTDRRVSPVEHIFSAFPTYLYLNASLGGALLEPLLETQASLVGQSSAAQDLGDSYPTASGPRAAPTQGIEQSGNMLITMLAHARTSGNGTLLSQYYAPAKRWADYLVNNTLTPSGQQNADQETTANMTNLAIKGIIGVKAMAEIARAVGQDSDATQYDAQASALLGSWQSLATSSDNSRLLGIYGNQQSWSLLYNLFADKLLGLNFIPQSVYTQQTQRLSSLLATAAQFGLPIDSAQGQTSNAAWILFASAFVSDNGVRDEMIAGVHNHANFNQTSGALSEIYNDQTGAGMSGYAGPALGALFSHLALTVPNTTISTSGGSNASGSGGSGSGSSKSNTGAIVGGVIGGLAVVGIAVGIFFVIRRKRRGQGQYDGEKIDIDQTPHRPVLAPYQYQNPTTGSLHQSYHADNGPDYAPVNVGSQSDLTAAGGFAGLAGAEAAGSSSTNVAYRDERPLPLPLSSKAREAALNRAPTYAPSVTASSAIGSATGTASSRDPLSPGETGASSLSPTDVMGLRSEVENLRRVMQEIRAERFEPPPEYVEE